MRVHWKYPNFLIGLFTFLTLILSVGFRANQMNGVGDVLLIATFVLGFVHWVWSIIDVLKHYRANKATENRNIFWVIVVLIVPPLGGLMYYAFGQNLNA